MDIYEVRESSVVGVKMVEDLWVNKYGIIQPENELEDGLVRISSLVEKPTLAEAPSRQAIMGRYVLTPAIFDLLESQAPGAGGEIQLTDALNELVKKESVLAYPFQGIRYDTGDKLSLIQATIELALERDDLKEDLVVYLKEKFLMPVGV